MRNTACPDKIAVFADDMGLSSQAGGLLLGEAAGITGLARNRPGQSLSGGLAWWPAPQAVY